MLNFLKKVYPYIITIAIVLFIRFFIVEPIRVVGTSMSDTLEEKEILFLIKVTRYFKDYKRDDIVVFEYEDNYLIKRILGTPGDTLECKDGIIYLNGKKYEDKYATNGTSDFSEITLKEEEYYLLGDNRIFSKDSRYFGPVKEKDLKGYADLVIFPFNKIRTVD